MMRVVFSACRRPAASSRSSAATSSASWTTRTWTTTSTSTRETARPSRSRSPAERGGRGRASASASGRTCTSRFCSVCPRRCPRSSGNGWSGSRWGFVGLLFTCFVLQILACRQHSSTNQPNQYHNQEKLTCLFFFCFSLLYRIDIIHISIKLM